MTFRFFLFILLLSVAGAFANDLDFTLVNQTGRSFAGADGGKFVDHVIDALFHRHLGLQKNVISVHVAGFLLRWKLIANQCPDFSPKHGIANIGGVVHSENDNRYLVVHAQAERS